MCIIKPYHSNHTFVMNNYIEMRCSSYMYLQIIIVYNNISTILENNIGE